jgi:hypothetical protein
MDFAIIVGQTINPPEADDGEARLTALGPRSPAQSTRRSIPTWFGEELDNAPYDRTDRIAVVALIVHARQE